MHHHDPSLLYVLITEKKPIQHVKYFDNNTGVGLQYCIILSILLSHMILMRAVADMWVGCE